MGSGADFTAWLATNPIDLDVEKLNIADIVKKEKVDLGTVTPNDNVGNGEEKEYLTTKAMMYSQLFGETKRTTSQIFDQVQFC